MPLLLMCGLPCSGKTVVVSELTDHLTKNRPNVDVALIADTDNTMFSSETYRDPGKEKEHRGYLRSEVQKRLNQDHLVILDSCNYIKGFRYELFCIAKNAKTSYCLVFCESSLVTVRRNNVESKMPEDKRYPDDILQALALRFETPDSRNRWDNPLFIVNPPEIRADFDEILSCLLDGKVLKPNQSTQSQPLAPTNFLYELDRVCQTMIESLFNQMQNAVPGDELLIPGVANNRIHLIKPWSLVELNRLKRQFINYTKANPVQDMDKLKNMFVTFLNSNNK